MDRTMGAPWSSPRTMPWIVVTFVVVVSPVGNHFFLCACTDRAATDRVTDRYDISSHFWCCMACLVALVPCHYATMQPLLSSSQVASSQKSTNFQTVHVAVQFHDKNAPPKWTSKTFSCIVVGPLYPLKHGMIQGFCSLNQHCV